MLDFLTAEFGSPGVEHLAIETATPKLIGPETHFYTIKLNFRSKRVWKKEEECGLHWLRTFDHHQASYSTLLVAIHSCKLLQTMVK